MINHPNRKKIENTADWLLGYAGKKTIKNFGGNFWGFNRKRCTIMQPEMIEALITNGYAARVPEGIVMIKKETV